MTEPEPLQTILVVDDELYVLNAVSNMLAHSGYTVLRATSADAALEIARTHRGPIDLLLSDRAEERRSLFEEAAGIGLYRDRRHTTARRLEETAGDPFVTIAGSLYLIGEAMELSNGVKARAAAMLNLNRTTLVEKMKRLGMEQ